MRGRFGRRRIFGGGSAVWMGIAVLAILALIIGRHEKTTNIIRVAYRTAQERFGGPEQPTRHDTASPSEQAGESLDQENPEEDTEGSTAEGEGDPGEEIKGITKESAMRSEEGDG
jgi:hypothetical protein